MNKQFLFKVREATPNDSEDLIRFSLNCPMEGDGISICHYRPKNYFLPYQVDGFLHKVFIAENDKDEIIGTATIKIQLTNIDNKLRKAAYLCDLKVHPKYRNGRIANQLVKSRINLLKELYPDEFEEIPIYLSVLENNKKMEKRLSKRDKNQTYFNKLSSIKTFSIPLFFKRKVRSNSTISLRKAKSEDLDIMSELWEKKNSNSDFYTSIKKDEILSASSLININHYKVITNKRNNKIIGFLGSSNFDEIKEIRIFKYSFKMKMVKGFLNFLFSLFKKSGLPEEGNPLKIIQTFHLCIDNLTKNEFSDFLTLIYNHTLDSDNVFLNINVPADFPYQEEFAPFLAQITNTDLYFSNNSSEKIKKGINYEVAFV